MSLNHFFKESKRKFARKKKSIALVFFFHWTALKQLQCWHAGCLSDIDEMKRCFGIKQMYFYDQIMINAIQIFFFILTFHHLTTILLG